MSQPNDPYDPHRAAPPAYPPAYPPPYPQPYPQAYPQPYPQPYGYGPHYTGYPPPGWRPGRPGTATAAAVLCYITAGFLILCAVILLLGASVIHDIGDDSTNLVTAELVVDAVLNLVAAGLLIAGSVSFTGGASAGRILLTVGSGITLGEGVYWLARAGVDVLFWVLVFAALVIIAVSLAWTSGPSTWLRAVVTPTR